MRAPFGDLEDDLRLRWDLLLDRSEREECDRRELWDLDLWLCFSPEFLG